MINIPPLHFVSRSCSSALERSLIDFCQELGEHGTASQFFSGLKGELERFGVATLDSRTVPVPEESFLVGGVSLEERCFVVRRGGLWLLVDVGADVVRTVDGGADVQELVSRDGWFRLVSSNEFVGTSGVVTAFVPFSSHSEYDKKNSAFLWVPAPSKSRVDRPSVAEFVRRELRGEWRVSEVLDAVLRFEGDCEVDLNLVGRRNNSQQPALTKDFYGCGLCLACFFEQKKSANKHVSSKRCKPSAADSFNLLYGRQDVPAESEVAINEYAAVYGRNCGAGDVVQVETVTGDNKNFWKVTFQKTLSSRKRPAPTAVFMTPCIHANVDGVSGFWSTSKWNVSRHVKTCTSQLQSAETSVQNNTNRVQDWRLRQKHAAAVVTPAPVPYVLAEVATTSRQAAASSHVLQQQEAEDVQEGDPTYHQVAARVLETIEEVLQQPTPPLSPSQMSVISDHENFLQDFDEELMEEASASLESLDDVQRLSRKQKTSLSSLLSLRLECGFPAEKEVFLWKLVPNESLSNQFVKQQWRPTKCPECPPGEDGKCRVDVRGDRGRVRVFDVGLPFFAQVPRFHCQEHDAWFTAVDSALLKNKPDDVNLSEDVIVRPRTIMTRSFLNYVMVLNQELHCVKRIKQILERLRQLRDDNVATDVPTEEDQVHVTSDDDATVPKYPDYDSDKDPPYQPSDTEVESDQESDQELVTSFPRKQSVKKQPERKPLEGCKSNCKKKCCESFTAEQRLTINQSYWSGDFAVRRCFLLDCVSWTETSRKTTGVGAPSRRNTTVEYCLKPAAGGPRVAVCKTFFLTTLGYKKTNDGAIQRLMKEVKNPPEGVSSSDVSLIRGDRRGRTEKCIVKHKFDHAIIKNHVETYRPCISHYRREHAPNRRYLPSDVHIKDMHKDFSEKHKDISYELYRSVVTNEMKISFAQLGHEQCELCEEYNLHKPSCQESDCKSCSTFFEHIGKANIARQLYREDADRCSNSAGSETAFLSADLQKVIMLPRMEHFKRAIFTRRIVAYNETFASLGKKSKVIAVTWHEGVAGRKDEDITSAFYKILMHHRDSKKIVIWVDNCGSQNKNYTLLTMLLTVMNSKLTSIETVTLKFFEAGHTFMSADAAHAAIERELRKMKSVYDYDDFLQCIKNANCENINMTFDCFHNWQSGFSNAKLAGMPNRPYLNEMSVIEIRSGVLEVFYKRSFQDPNFESFRCFTRGVKFRVPQSRSEPKGICIRKKKDILKLVCPLMPDSRRIFWNSLPTGDDSDDM